MNTYIQHNDIKKTISRNVYIDKLDILLMNIIIYIIAQLKRNLLMQRQKAMFQICLKTFFGIKKVENTCVIRH